MVNVQKDDLSRGITQHAAGVEMRFIFWVGVTNKLVLFVTRFSKNNDAMCPQVMEDEEEEEVGVMVVVVVLLKLC